MAEALLNVASSSDEFALSQTEQALRLFSSSVEKILGVLETHRYQVGRSKEEGVMVVVADLFSSITHDVIRAKEMVYDTIPGIRFAIDIRDVSTINEIARAQRIAISAETA